MIKVTIGGEPKQKKQIPFPKVMTYTDGDGLTTIILAKAQKESSGNFIGTCLHSEEKDLKVGDYSEYYHSDFEDYNEPITLQNED